MPLDRELVPVLNSDPLLARNSHSIASLPPLGYSRLTEYHSTEKVLTGVTPKNLQNCQENNQDQHVLAQHVHAGSSKR